MEVIIKLNSLREVPVGFTGIVEIPTVSSLCFHGAPNRFWYANGKLHRENGPAAEYQGGTKIWVKHGKYHREDGAAYITSDFNDYFLNHERFESIIDWFNALTPEQQGNALWSEDLWK